MGTFIADLIVEGAIVVELKAVAALGNAQRAQCLNYLKAAGLNVCLLFNFGTPRIEVKRIVRNFETRSWGTVPGLSTCSANDIRAGTPIPQPNAASPA